MTNITIVKTEASLYVEASSLFSTALDDETGKIRIKISDEGKQKLQIPDSFLVPIGSVTTKTIVPCTKITGKEYGCMLVSNKETEAILKPLLDYYEKETGVKIVIVRQTNATTQPFDSYYSNSFGGIHHLNDLLEVLDTNNITAKLIVTDRQYTFTKSEFIRLFNYDSSYKCLHL